jgi:lysophospholipid acyltransferase (LPLAT)-like uncharacterized protein
VFALSEGIVTMANRSRTPILALNVRGNLAATDENNSDSVAIFLFTVILLCD